MDCKFWIGIKGFTGIRSFLFRDSNVYVSGPTTTYTHTQNPELTLVSIGGDPAPI